MSRIEKKLELCYENGNYYEAHQIYRTLYNRMSGQGKWQELKDMLYSGALRLLAVKEATSAIDLAELYVEALEKSRTPVSSSVLHRFEELFSRLPAQLEKDLGSNSEQEDRRKQYISLGIKWTMSVSDKKSHRQKGHPALHLCLAKSLWREGDYVSARNHFIHSGDPETFAKFLIDYHLKYGYAVEKDLFIAQAVLQMLCNRKLKSSSVLLRAYCDMHPGIRSPFPYSFPLLNFLHFAIIAIANKEVAIYTALIEQYENEINRDPEYKHYLDRIGQVYLDLPEPRTARSGFLGNIIKGLLRAPGSGSEAGEQSDTDSEESLCIPLSDERSAGNLKTKSVSKISPANAVQNDAGITDDMELD